MEQKEVLILSYTRDGADSNRRLAVWLLGGSAVWLNLNDSELKVLEALIESLSKGPNSCEVG